MLHFNSDTLTFECTIFFCAKLQPGGPLAPTFDWQITNIKHVYNLQPLQLQQLSQPPFSQSFLAKMARCVQRSTLIFFSSFTKTDVNIFPWRGITADMLIVQVNMRKINHCPHNLTKLFIHVISVT